ncbi:MAG: hypothetical protein K6U74_17640 [Firmicutes bacterium]|nr:hypothetical protein [Bacillota bacterium]
MIIKRRKVDYKISQIEQKDELINALKLIAFSPKRLIFNQDCISGSLNFARVLLRGNNYPFFDQVID